MIACLFCFTVHTLFPLWKENIHMFRECSGHHWPPCPFWTASWDSTKPEVGICWGQENHGDRHCQAGFSAKWTCRLLVSLAKLDWMFHADAVLFRKCKYFKNLFLCLIISSYDKTEFNSLPSGSSPRMTSARFLLTCIKVLRKGQNLCLFSKQSIAASKMRQKCSQKWYQPSTSLLYETNVMIKPRNTNTWLSQKKNIVTSPSNTDSSWKPLILEKSASSCSLLCLSVAANNFVVSRSF